MADGPHTSTSPADHRRLISSANLISRLTMASRIFGLLRDKICSYFLGVGTVWSAFWMGFQIPNLFRRIFGEGALTALFVPAYTTLQMQEGREAADQFARSVLVLLLVVLSAITALGECILLPLAFNPHLLPENRLAAGMIALMLPYTVAICLTAMLGAFSAVHQKFAAQSLAPITTSVLMALAAALPALYFAAHAPLTARIWWVALAVLASGVVQLFMLGVSAHRCGLRWGSVTFASPAVRSIIRRMGVMIVGFSAVQINTFLDSQIAWWFSPDGHNGARTVHVGSLHIHLPMLAGALGKLSVAQRIYMLPVGVFGVAIATAIFPRLSKLAAESNVDELKDVLRRAFRRGLFLSLPATIGMILIAHKLISAIYLGGHGSQADVNRATHAARWFCAGIWAFELQMILIRVFYAFHDSHTPMKVAVAAVVLNLILNLLLIWPLGVAGIAASTTASAIFQCALLAWLLRRRIGPLQTAQMGGMLVRVAAAIIAMAASAMAADWACNRWVRIASHPIVGNIIGLAVMVAVAAAVYGLCARWLNIPELAHAPIIGRLSRQRSGKDNTRG